jgi:hypothetical protein
MLLQLSDVKICFVTKVLYIAEVSTVSVLSSYSVKGKAIPLQAQMSP